MKQYHELTKEEKEQLLQFPAYISLLASTAEEGIDKAEKKAAVKLTHIKTFSCNPLLKDFYKDAEGIFEPTISHLNKTLPHTRAERIEAIHQALANLEPLLKKMEPSFASVLRKSMQDYKHHVSKAHRNVLEYFIFPMPVSGITD